VILVPVLVIGGIGLLLYLAIQGKAAANSIYNTTPGPVPVVSDNPILLAMPDDSLADTADAMTNNWVGSISTDRNSWPTGDKIWDICRAIAVAEGYNTNGAAFQLNNPGDLSPGDEYGQPTGGVAEWHGGSYIIHFASAFGGWNALYTKVSNIIFGKSKVYGQNWTISQIAEKWAGNSTAWANNVAKELGYNDPSQYGFDDYAGV